MSVSGKGFEEILVERFVETIGEFWYLFGDTTEHLEPGGRVLGFILLVCSRGRD